MPLGTYITFALPWFVCVPAVGGFPFARATLGIIRAAITKGSIFFITDSLLCSFRPSPVPRSSARGVRASTARCKWLVKRAACAWLRDRKRRIYRREIRGRQARCGDGERLNQDPNKQLQRQASRDPAAERSETVRNLNTQLRKVMKLLAHDRDH